MGERIEYSNNTVVNNNGVWRETGERAAVKRMVGCWLAANSLVSRWSPLAGAG